MYTFKDIKNNKIPFENIRDLQLSTTTDIVTDEVSAYLVEYNDGIYEVDETTYEAIKNKQ